MTSLEQLERIASRGWQGTSSEQLGDWLLRAGGGFTGRANSVLALGSAGVELPDALAAVQAFYHRHELPAMFQIPFHGGSESPLSAALLSGGWQSFNETSVLTAPIPVASSCFRPGPGVAVVENEPSERWLSGYHYRGRPLPANAIAVLINASDPVFVSLVDGGELLGVARGIVTDGWLGVTAVTVPPEHRRRGAGSAVMAAVLEWAGDRAHSAYLQVDAANAPAVAMYGRGGFVEHHRYHYLRQTQPG